MGARRPRPQPLDPRLGRLRVPARAHGAGRARGLLGREHLLPRAVDPRLLGAARRAGRAGLPRPRAHGQRHPRLQPRVPLDVRALGARGLPAGPRADRQRRSGARGRPRLRLLALSGRAVRAPAGHLVPVDAVRAAVAVPLSRHAPRPVAGRRRRGAPRAEPVVRLLPPVLSPVRGRVGPVGDGAARPAGRHPAVARARRRRGPGGGGHRALPRAVRARARRRRRPASRAGAGALLRGRLLVPHGPRGPALLGAAAFGLPQVRGGAVSRRRPAPARPPRRGGGCRPGLAPRRARPARRTPRASTAGGRPSRPWPPWWPRCPWSSRS